MNFSSCFISHKLLDRLRLYKNEEKISFFYVKQATFKPNECSVAALEVEEPSDRAEWISNPRWKVPGYRWTTYDWSNQNIITLTLDAMMHRGVSIT